MPDPSNNKAKPKVRRGPQLKPLPKVVIEAVAQEKLPVVSDAGLSVKPSDEAIVTQESKEEQEDTVVVPIFGVTKAKKKAEKPEAKAPEAKAPEAPKPAAKPAFSLKRVDVAKPVAEAPPAGPKKSVLLPDPEPVVEAEPAVEETQEAKPVIEEAPKLEEAAPPAGPKSRFKVRPQAIAPGPKETLDGFTLTAEEQDFLSKLTEPELKDLAKAIITIEKQNPYKAPVPSDGFVPENRRAFTNFINTTFSEFKLALPKLDPKACDKLTGTQTATMYKYQEFVRDYMQWQSPYRGLLIYHGLGSGKTCSAIAAAEALFSQGNRRIIVLTPASLQENFLKEISFCGFEHFRLNNNWIGIPKNPGTQPLIMLFAEKVLRIPKQYLERADVDTIWIPDFRKRTATTTIRSSKAFKDLNEKEKQQVREQIENIVFRVDSKDPKKRRHGRIQFISYNGVGKEQLRQIAAQAEAEGGFDNAVIIVDEVHNLVRNMQGQIDPFLIDLPGKRKKISFDPVTHERWVPKQAVSYPRGILFYRLLAGAKNSKIIGLSGTPIINFPEEVGILMNILHGYNHIGTSMIGKQAADSQQKLLKLKNEFSQAAKEFRFTDFYEAIIDTEKGVKFTVTMLPEGIRKIDGKQGVERIPMNEDSVSYADRFTQFEAFLRTKKVFEDGTKFSIHSEPLLPPTRDAFNEAFANPANDFILMKRMSGLVSYYKGSRKDLMPEKTEVVVQCPMSLFAQKYYLQLRAAEMKLEEAAQKKKKKAKGTGTLSKFWAMAYDIENLDVANSYRVATRQACNFAFPKEVRRPRPADKEDLKEETGLDRDPYIDDLGAETKPGDSPDDEGDEISNTQEQEEELEAVADEEDQATLLEDLQSQLAALKEMATAGEIDEEELTSQIEEITKQFQEAMLERAMFIGEETEKEEESEVVEAAQTQSEKYCTAIKIRPDEKYKERITRAMKCLKDVTGDKLVYGSTLPVLSAKFEYMIQNILKIKEEKHGSNLVYSNYLSMEGLGIFTMILDIMGWKKIIIEESGTDLKFSKETLESLAEGPNGTTPRYIYFTGGEKNKVRKAAINVFNFNLKDLPPSLTKTLEESGFTDNKQGTLCNLFCITSAGAEGLSLHNVRAVHIMEPHWNDVRMAQVKGRAIRICSHKALDMADRNVTVYTYLTTFSDLVQVLSSNDRITDPKLKEERTKEESKLSEWTLPHEIISSDSEKISVDDAKKIGLQISEDVQSTYYVTTDIALANLGVLKKETSDRIQKLMKTGAVDCELNYNENQDGTFSCIKFEEKLGEGGDFLYHPSLKEDITRWTKHQFAKVDVQAMEVKKETYQKVKFGKPPKEYILKPTRDTTGKITHYEIYPSGTSEFTDDVKWGTLNANSEGNPVKAATAFHKKK
jgi:hypothetical protein